MRPHRIEVHIEELVLHGFSPADRLRIGGAVERELARLLQQAGPEALRTREQESLDAGSFERSPQATPGAIGEAVAGSVAGALRR